MIHYLSNVLEPAELAAISEVCAAARFADGRSTAGPGARTVKHNEQAARDAEVDGALSMVRDRLARHPLVRAAALPKRFVRLTVSRYAVGMEYGAHTDNALISGRRTDLSFTLGLDSGGPYQGGELVLMDPATYSHRVAPVTEGVRLVVIGWITSRVRSAECRETLFDLRRSARFERERNGKTERYDRLERIHQNLLRRWSEDD